MGCGAGDIVGEERQFSTKCGQRGLRHLELDLGPASCSSQFALNKSQLDPGVAIKRCQENRSSADIR